MKKETGPKSNYPKVTTWDVVKEYWKSVRKYKISGTIFLLGIIVFVTLLTIVSPLFYKDFFDALANTSDPSESVSLLINILIIIASINAFSWLAKRTSDFTANYFTARVMDDLRVRAYQYLLGHSYSFFSNNFAGSLVQKVNRFVKSFQWLSHTILSDFTSLVIRVVGTGIVLFIIEPKIAYAMYIWMVLWLTLSYFIARYKLRYDTQAAIIDSKITGKMSDSISNHSSVQLFTATEIERDELQKINRDLTLLSIKRWNIASVVDAVQSALTFGIEFFIFYYAIKYWEMNIISIGIFTLIQSYILSLTHSLWGFGVMIRDVYESVADAKEMVEILHLPHEIKNIPGAVPIVVEKGAIEFKDVTFAFGENKPVMNRLNLTIKAGEKVALIGSSGAGKSTLVRLLMRLYDTRGGEILIDGQNIQKVTQESLRENISLVPQDPALFHRTLMENIRYGKRDASDAEVIEAAKLAHCDVFIDTFPQKYETYVGERGVKLSGGERQRVAIARALLKNAPILVLDEATSSLDSHSESLIQDALDTLMKGKTTLVIAHRLSTIKKMDRIIVLGKDGIMEQGSHDELLKIPNGTYAHLWKLQAGGFADKNIEEMLEE
ncbi:MAG: ABC transporter ATP-binding protein [Patescibacteria group bacterium]